MKTELPLSFTLCIWSLSFSDRAAAMRGLVVYLKLDFAARWVIITSMRMMVLQMSASMLGRCLVCSRGGIASRCHFPEGWLSPQKAILVLRSTVIWFPFLLHRVHFLSKIISENFSTGCNQSDANSIFSLWGPAVQDGRSFDPQYHPLLSLSLWDDQDFWRWPLRNGLLERDYDVQ